MRLICAVALAGALVAPKLATAQSITPTREEVVALTSEWTGERFPDGRPKVPDAILQRMKKVNLEEAWSVLRSKGFQWQYEGRWKHVHLEETAVMVGRALTATFVPRRPDLDKALTEKGHAAGHIGGRNSWPIDMLQKDDVYGANVCSSRSTDPPASARCSAFLATSSSPTARA
jgi:4-hydroxy-4-methyl-2-oxoglutarate aldolase